MMSKNKENIEKLENSLILLHNNENIIYFLTYDTKNNPSAAVKHIYDIALTLKNNGFNTKILVEDNSYVGVKNWLGDKYDALEVVSIKEDKVQIKIEDVLVVPELYSNVLQQLSNIKCTKVMLVQQKEYIFESLPIGSKWIDFGFDQVITTTEKAKEYIEDVFPQSKISIIPPIIGDNFKKSEQPVKPFIAISCRERVISRKIISEFYLKYPHLRWITFKDMIQLSYDEFSDALNECMVSVWIDDESTFGTFPLESMKCGVPVVGKIPDTEPDWLTENGMWTYDANKIVELLGTYILAWLEGIELTQEVKDKMKDTLVPYSKEITEKNILKIFTSYKNNRISKIQLAIEKIKQEEVSE
jgi:glycosyltransferase involved in cell wall biosynthesis